MSLIPFAGAVQKFNRQRGGYQIERSLRFNSADSAYLSRTPAGASNQNTATFSVWVKLSQVNFIGYGSKDIYNARTGTSSPQFNIRFLFYNAAGATPLATDVLNLQIFQQGMSLVTSQIFRDPSAWYHIVVAFDSTQATDTNRVKLYVNGAQVTAFQVASYPAQNFNFNFNAVIDQYIGRDNANGTNFDGYMADFNFIDGSALDPTSFGEYNTDTGVWQPIEYTGSYGTNGFYLNFSDNSGVTSTTLGADSSGNGNNWTPNNFSVTAGAGNDSLVDTPTNYGVDTGAGGEVRGNYATFNPLGTNNIATFANGNLDTVTGSGASTVGATFGMTTGKWYAEFVCTAKTSTNMGVAIVRADTFDGDNQADEGTNIGYMYLNNGLIYHGSSESYGASWSTGDVIGVAFDADTRYVTFYVNGASQGQYTRIASENAAGFSWMMAVSEGQGGATASFTANFGQRPFAYTAPSGFKALCTQNLPEPTIVDGGEYFNTVLYTGTGATQSITGVGFQPGWVWGKSRSNATNNFLYDSVRGVNKRLISDSTAAETDETGGGLSSFNSDGFTVEANSTENGSARTFVAWNWNAGGSTVTNTSGSISAQVRANIDSGFSIVTYTGTGSAATVGHGLGVAPSMVIVKNRSATWGWFVYNRFLTNPNTGRLQLNLTNAEIAGGTPGPWNNTAPTSTVFSIGDSIFPEVNGSGNSLVAYCFAAIPGYSAFGSYTGNGSADGSFVYLGFRPRFVLIKSSSNISNWIIFDSARGSYNVNGPYLYANGSNAEGTSSTVGLDFLSNGFKNRNDYGDANTSGYTYIYAAFSEAAFKYSLGR